MAKQVSARRDAKRVFNSDGVVRPVCSRLLGAGEFRSLAAGHRPTGRDFVTPGSSGLRTPGDRRLYGAVVDTGRRWGWSSVTSLALT